MFLPRDRRPDSSLYDCIVIGSGPAGITTALELEKAGRRTLILESEDGGGDVSPSIGYGHFSGNYWNAHSIRALGGTSNAWAGFVSTPRTIDFDHPVVAVSWPIDRAALVPFYRRALPYLERRLPVVDFERPIMPGWIFRPFSWRQPVRFGERYRKHLSESSLVDVMLGFSAVGFTATGARSAITAVQGFDHGTKSSVTVPIAGRQAVVLAAGGIGNPQLLLQPADGSDVAIGNESGLVGKFLMEHPHVYDAGECVTELPFGRHAPPGLFGRAVNAVVADGDLEARHGLMACSLEFLQRDPEHELARHFSSPRRVFAHYQINARSEMRPTAHNRVFLTAERSRSGLLQAAVRCVLSAEDLLNIERTLRLLGESMIRGGRGRVRVRNEAIYREVTGGGHVMGTTRMGRSPASSVVDADCRVHGYANLYLAGSSVFTTGGYANPTFTIVALAARLADRIVEDTA